MQQLGVRHLLVAAPGRLILGAVCEADVRRAGPDERVLSRLLTVPMVGPATPARRVIALLRRTGACCAGVFMNDRPAAIITLGDLVRARLSGEAVPRCASCADHHRLAGRGCVWFCADCLDDSEPGELDDLYVDLGGGD